MSRLVGVGLSAAMLLPIAAPAQTAASNNPQVHFVPRTETFDYVKRAVMIPMRDGVKLRTVILIPRGAHNVPMILTRTPYGADARFGAASSHITMEEGQGDPADPLVLEDGYIRVMQDVRGQHMSEGAYVMTRPFVGPLNPTNVDHSTDTYDTIDWLVKHVPESNGRVGMTGISYDGFTTLAALVHPHPALKAVAPINPMVDGWMGDDFFHYGAFRLVNLSYIYDQESRGGRWWSSDYDMYTEALRAVSAGGYAQSRGLEQLEFWKSIAAHPAYDAFWQQQAMDKILAAQPLTVPTLLTAAIWDQEDMYGAQAVYRAIAAAQPGNGNLHLVMGPWYHHQERQDGSALGPIAFGSDTALYYREEILRPFFRRYLGGDTSVPAVAPVTAFVTGEDRWERLARWPEGCPSGCTITDRKLYLHPDGTVAFDAPSGGAHATSYVSDPSKPVPFITRPVNIDGANGTRWQTWLVQDQREFGSRPDVVSWESAPVRERVQLAGAPIANVVASTTGTDGDFVVKLIDVYPDEMGRDPQMGGYQLAIATDIFRGRYRTSFSNPQPIEPNTMLAYRFALPNVNHVFLPGHRMLVQIQSTLFPLYDRNPQTFVANMLFAPPGAYHAATIRIADGADGSYVELPVVR